MPIGLTDVYTGTVPGDRTGTPGRDCFEIMNANSAIIEAAMEDAELKAFVVKCVAKDVAVAPEDSVEWWRQPYAFVVLEVRAAVYTPQSGDDILLDILTNGSSILDTGGLVIPAGSETSTDSPISSPVILADNSKMTIDIVDAGSGATATGLEVTIIGYVIWTSF